MKVVIYDKWLHSLGGGEVVACNIARILKDEGHKILFISGKVVDVDVIYDQLKIDLKDIEFTTVWNDEIALKKLTKNQDLFINISFLDYSIGFAKKNIYYVNFPTKIYNNFTGALSSRFVIPIILRLIKPMEVLSKIEAPVVLAGRPAYLLRNHNKFALPNLIPGQPKEASFKIYLSNFYKSFLEHFKVFLENSQILNQAIRINHATNTIEFTIKFIPESLTAYLNLNFKRLEGYHSIQEEKVYLFYPKIYLNKLPNFLLGNFIQRVVTRLRAGVFVNASERLNTYQTVITYSYFGWKWIRKYWRREAKVIAPPVDLLFKKNRVGRFKKNNWICSVGRFFTLGHGKKQEILIEAFKKLCGQNKKKWELHLVGGLGDEPSSIEFFQYLKNKSKGYPVFFHVNVSRQEVEKVYLRSKIYWHATGFGEDENYQPIRFEHFGIAPIEALSAKCIPILFNGGGLREIISSLNLDKRKHLFSTIDELVNNTIYYQNKQNQKLDWQFIFRKLEEHYSQETFKEKFLEVLSSMK